MVEPTVTITELTAQRERVRKREADIKTKRAKIKAFQGLPPVRVTYSSSKQYRMLTHL